VFHHLPVSDAHDIDKPNFQDIYSGCCTVAAQSYSSGRLICEVLERLKPVGVDEHLEDGARLDHAGRTRVIFTLGHTPGHARLYLERPKVLIAGDALTPEWALPKRPEPAAHPGHARCRTVHREAGGPGVGHHPLLLRQRGRRRRQQTAT
jgi:glyoxylase-like metal-dependent hydrolase (beta-lactamase superfamily II)